MFLNKSSKTLAECTICKGHLNKGIGSNYPLLDGVMCSNCFEKLDSLNRNLIFNDRKSSKMSVAEVKELIGQQYEDRPAYQDEVLWSHMFGGIFEISDNMKLFRVNISKIGGEIWKVFDTSPIYECEIIENGQTTMNTGLKGTLIGGLAGTIVGGPLTAATGAIVGTVASKNLKNIVDCIEVNIFMNDSARPSVRVSIHDSIISKPLDKSSIEYQHKIDLARDILAAIKQIIIMNSNADEHIEQTPESIQQDVVIDNTESYSVADEIRKFKTLLDDGIITQAEFDAKKQQLLGL